MMEKITMLRVLAHAGNPAFVMEDVLAFLMTTMNKVAISTITSTSWH